LASVRVSATTANPPDTIADTIAVGAFAGKGIAHDVGGGVLQGLLDKGEASTSLGRIAQAHADGRRWIVVGLGERDRFDAESARVAAAHALRRAMELGCTSLCWEVPHHVSGAVVAGLVEGTLLKAYRFTRYKPPAASDPVAPEELIVSAHHDVAAPVDRAAVIATAQNRARDLGNTAANDLTPAALAEHAAKIADAFDGVSFEALDGAAIHAAGMGAFASVAAGTAVDPRLIVLDYHGAEGAPLALIGKAVTFDSGGLSLKAADRMMEMKFDMCGGAAVLEAIWALASLQAPVRVRAIVGATENLPGPTATKPGDIVRALDGTAIQVDNTDAEGRLVLGDCITYAIRGGCSKLVDIATLTGGVVAALGYVYAGLCANDDSWAAAVERAAADSGELVWRLPLHPRYAEMIKGRYGQITNKTDRREAMTITAAEFLHHFAGSTPWAHLDIAGTAWNVPRPYFDKGATGIGVRLLTELALSSA
jgi:leucyl aminopeptidase